MKLPDLVHFAGTALAGHRLRTGLSLLGVAIGVAAVVLLTALGEGARRYVTDQFESLGTNLLIVIPGKTDTAGGMPGIAGAPNDLTIGDAEALRRKLPVARRVVPVAIGSETVARHKRQRQVLVIGTTEDFLYARQLSVARGRFLPRLDLHRTMPVTVIGPKVASELFPGENALGKVVHIGGQRMRVIGLLASRGVQLAVDMDEVAFVPVTTGMRMFNRSSLFRILIEVRAHGDIDSTRARALKILRERHGEEDVTCLTQDSVLGAFSSILVALSLALAGIAAISLTVAGIGIMNVMLVSVSERTSEIGLLKAIGATNRQVLAVFLSEAVLISTTGGVLGLGGSWLAGQAVHWRYPTFPLEAPVWAVGAALAVSLGTGVLFGILPAMRATRLDPVTALTGR
ncbi:ABC transporter permease [Planctomycetota bacterium]